jgi:hypothetical protein
VGGGTLALDAIWFFAVFLVLVILAAVVLATRRFLLERGGGTVECGLRHPARRGNWRLGVAAYQQDELYWYGALGVLLRPEHIYNRRALSVVSRRPALPSETVVLGADRIVVELATGAAASGPGLPVGEDAERVELAMTEQALTGFLAWIEAAPPGSHLGDILTVIAAAQRRSAVAAGTPQHVSRAGVAFVRRPGQDEQQVG